MRADKWYWGGEVGVKSDSQEGQQIAEPHRLRGEG